MTAETTKIPEVVPTLGTRRENVGADELTVAEVEAIFANQVVRPDASTEATPTAMSENDMDAVLRSLGEDTGMAWFPTWAAGPPPKSTRPNTDPNITEDAVLSEIHQVVKELESSVATVDDTTVATRDRVTDLAEEIRTQQIQLNDVAEDVGAIKAQNAALAAELSELRGIMLAVRNNMASLVRSIMTGMKPGTTPSAVAPSEPPIA